MYIVFMKIILIVLSVLLVLFLIMSYSFNKSTERQKYKLIKKINKTEIRFYPKAIMASVESSSETYMGNSSDNFRKLAGYIFGANQSSNKISMTAPVYMEKDTASSKMSFVMPAQYNLNDLPKPQDSTIELHYSEEGYFAAIKFGGFANEKIILKKQEELRQELSDLKIQMIGNFFYLGYNAPWDVINRENEVIVKIHYSEEL